MDNLNLLTSIAAYKYNCMEEVFNFLNELKKDLMLPDQILLKVAPRLLTDKYLLNNYQINDYMIHYLVCKGQLS